MSDYSNAVTVVGAEDLVEAVDSADALDARNWAAAESLEYRAMQPETPEGPVYTLDN